MLDISVMLGLLKVKWWTQALYIAYLCYISGLLHDYYFALVWCLLYLFMLMVVNEGPTQRWQCAALGQDSRTDRPLP